MKSLIDLVCAWRDVGRTKMRRAVWSCVALALLACGLELTVSAQTVYAADRGGLTLSAGGTGSGYFVGYGGTKLLGVSAFVDVDTMRHFGVEGEARWLVFHQTNEVHAATYMAGPRFSMNYGRLQPYAKAMAGFGQFNFPYNYGKGSYLVVAGGGGVDYRLTHRIRWRAVDFEYQMWPQFTYNSMSSYGVSTGIRVRIF